MRVNVRGVTTNKPPTGPYRGAGGPEAAFCMERTMDLVATELGLDPSHVRRINMIHPDALPYTTPYGHHLRLWQLRGGVGQGAGDVGVPAVAGTGCGTPQAGRAPFRGGSGHGAQGVGGLWRGAGGQLTGDHRGLGAGHHTHWSITPWAGNGDNLLPDGG